MPMNNLKKQGGQLQKSGFERGSKRSGGGSANDNGDSDNMRGHKLENGHSNAAMAEALVRILTLKCSIDILRDVLMHLAPRSKRWFDNSVM
ncbi:hypothetical protein AB3S75_038146 [Citrus x aurantiifolia]